MKIWSHFMTNECRKAVNYKTFPYFILSLYFCAPPCTVKIFFCNNWLGAVSSQKEKNGRDPLRIHPTSHFELTVFPLDTAKNHRLNSIVHQYYWQRLFMQLTADYLSHSLLTGNIDLRKRERWMTEGGEEWGKERVRDRTGTRERWNREANISSQRRLFVVLATNPTDRGWKINGETCLFWHRSERAQ